MPNLLVAGTGPTRRWSGSSRRRYSSGAAAIARAVPAAAALDRRAAIETAPVPLHPAALRWFRDTKA